MSVPAKQPTAIQLRRGTSLYWASIDVAPGYFKPRNGEPIYETDTGKVKIGDGNTRYINLDYLADTANLNINDLSDVTIASPQNDQGIIYEGGVWKNKTVIAAASVAKTKPSPATDGALWFDPEDARLYRYYDDGTGTPQWVEINQTIAQQSNTFTSGVTMGSTLGVTGITTLGTANITTANLTNPLGVADGGTGGTTGSGLVNIVPVTGDVVASGGTLTSISTYGKVDFANVTSIKINNLFSANYDVYEVYFIPTSTTSSDYYYSRFSTSGTINTSSSYYSAGLYQQGGNVASWDTAISALSYAKLGYVYATNSSYTMLRIMNPYSNTLKTEYAFNSAYGQGSHTQIYGSCLFDATTRFDGIVFGSVTAGNLTGSIQVFGLKK